MTLDPDASPGRRGLQRDRKVEARVTWKGLLALAGTVVLALSG